MKGASFHIYVTDHTWSGFFLVLDGIDGCGKSTQAKKLYNYLKKKKITSHLTTEPSKGELGQILRKYLQKEDNPATLDALLFAADRIDHCYHEILPLLHEKKIVISDRYRDSSLIYQSIQGKEEGITREWVQLINNFSLKPDLTVIIDLDPQIALSRKVAQNATTQAAMEKFEELTFQQQIRKGFAAINKQNSTNDSQENYIMVDGNQDPEQVFQIIIKKLRPYLQEKGISL